ncbi:MAG: UDP-N-acetylglucosamine--LPS N-acetylglucosamine transferase [Nocardioides sp.]
MTRVLLVGSSGGHLAQLMTLRPWWEQSERAWVCFDTIDAIGQLADEDDVTWAYRPTTRNIPNLLRNTWQAVRVLRGFRPDVIVSTGAAVAFPYFVLGWLTRRRTVYIEVYDRIDSPTMTGRLVRPFADLMLTQWPEQNVLYDDAIQIGPLL